MPINLHTGAKAVGLAALISTFPAAWAADEAPAPEPTPAPPLSVSWANKTIVEGGPNLVDLAIGVDLSAVGFYHDVDDIFFRDAVYRTFSATTPDLDLDGNPGEAEDYQLMLAGFSGTWTAGETSFADGLEVEDAEIYLRGSAYDRIVFRLQVDAENGAAQLDKWYLGVTGIPGLGTVTIREVDNDQDLRSEMFYEDSIAVETFEPRELVGVQAENDYLGDRLGYLFAIGMVSGEPGTTDKNYDIQGQIYGTPVLTDRARLDLGLFVELINPSPASHVGYSEGLTYDVDLEFGPTLISLPAATEDAICYTFAANLSVGRMFLGGEYSGVEANAPTDPDLESQNLMELLARDETRTYANPTATQVGHLDVYNDWSASGATITAAFSITGEAQEPDGGIAAPDADLAFDGSGYGALEVVARYSIVDIEDDSRDLVQQLNPMASVAPTINDVLDSIIQASTNRQEGGEGDQMSAGVNWYPTAGMRFGLYFNHQNWEYDSGALTGINSASVTAAAPVLSTTDMAAMMTYLIQSQVENDYSVDSVYFEGKVSF